MELLDIWYSIPTEERIAYVPNMGRIVVKSIEWKHKVKELLPGWNVVTSAEALLFVM